MKAACGQVNCSGRTTGLARAAVAPSGTFNGRQRKNKFSNVPWSAHADLATLEYWGTSGELPQPETAFCYYFRIAATQHMGWSHVSVGHMLRHFQHSTRTTYSSGINWWVDFCNEYQLDIFRPTIQTLEIFFIMLFGTTKLIGSTIRTYKIAISYLFLMKFKNNCTHPTSKCCWTDLPNNAPPYLGYPPQFGTLKWSCITWPGTPLTTCYATNCCVKRQ